MCYNLKALLKTQLNRAIQNADVDKIKEIEEKMSGQIKDYHHVSGFSNPPLLIYYENESTPVVAHWGLIPHWIKHRKDAKSIRAKTLNARVETLFQKPSFRMPIKQRRCIIYMDGFYEYYHFKSNTYPHFIYKNGGGSLRVAGLWDEWVDPSSGEMLKTFSIITTKGKGIMEKIHNNPKLEEARMPLMLSDELAEEWLKPHSISSEKDLVDYTHSPIVTLLDYHSVGPLLGKNYCGNVDGVGNFHEYQGLTSN